MLSFWRHYGFCLPVPELIIVDTIAFTLVLRDPASNPFRTDCYSET